MFTLGFRLLVAWVRKVMADLRKPVVSDNPLDEGRDQTGSGW